MKALEDSLQEEGEEEEEDMQTERHKASKAEVLDIRLVLEDIRLAALEPSD